MKILGLQKVTLIDYPEKIACTLFIFGCNFRCGFCHNPNLVVEGKDFEEYLQKEIFEFLKSRKKYLEGICITGGEPLLTLKKEFLKKIKELGYLIKIDTNGSFPEKLKEFIGEGLVDFVAMDIKNSQEKYEKTINVKIDLTKIEESIKLISQLKNYEFRTTIIEGLHEIKDVEKISKWLNEVAGKKPEKFVLQGFKKEAKLLDEDFKKIKNTGEEFLNEIKEKIKNYFKEIKVRA